MKLQINVLRSDGTLWPKWQPIFQSLDFENEDNLINYLRSQEKGDQGDIIYKITEDFTTLYGQKYVKKMTITNDSSCFFRLIE